MPINSTKAKIQKITGQVLIIGFGSIGRATLPLILKHFELSPLQITIIDPSPINKSIADLYGVKFKQIKITKENFKSEIAKVLKKTTENVIINVAIEVGSVDILAYAPEVNAYYIDTVVEPWPGHYFNHNLNQSQQTNYALRESMLKLKPKLKTTPTAISCCGANPGMVSWLLKEALLKLADDLGKPAKQPSTKYEWSLLMHELGVKGIHIAERDSQHSDLKREPGWFINTWSPEGFAAEALQPAELGWGTNEKNLPQDGRLHPDGCQSAIYLTSASGKTKVQTWTPTFGAHFGYLITHNEAISISDYYTLRDSAGEVVYRPTCHYAYHPTAHAIASLEEFFNERNNQLQENRHVLTEVEITDGYDELGVLLYGHEKGAFWYGSQLSIVEARGLAPHQNATGLQVSSAIITGLAYVLTHKNFGVLEADEMDHEFCLNFQRPYLGKVTGYYTDWKPAFKSVAENDPWQFSNIRLI